MYFNAIICKFCYFRCARRLKSEKDNQLSSGKWLILLSTINSLFKMFETSVFFVSSLLLISFSWSRKIIIYDSNDFLLYFTLFFPILWHIFLYSCEKQKDVEKISSAKNITVLLLCLLRKNIYSDYDRRQDDEEKRGKDRKGNSTKRTQIRNGWAENI